MHHAIDKSIKVGDRVKPISTTLTTETCIVISISGRTCKIRPWRAYQRGSAARDIMSSLGKVQHVCHNHKAPFLDLHFDDCDTYIDGYRSGRYWALCGDIYQAGGPGMGSKPSEKDCHHWAQYCELEALQNKIWCEGWRAGQKSRDDFFPYKDGMQVRVVCINETGYDTRAQAVGIIENVGGDSWAVKWIDGEVRYDHLLDNGRYKTRDRLMYVEELKAETNLDLPKLPPPAPENRVAYQRIYGPKHGMDPYIMSEGHKTAREASVHHSGPCDVVEVIYKEGRAVSVRLIEAKDI